MASRRIAADRGLRSAIGLLIVLIVLIVSALAWSLLSSSEDDIRSAPDSQTKKVAPQRDDSGNEADQGTPFRSLRRKAIEG